MDDRQLSFICSFKFQTALASLLLWAAFPPISCWPLAIVSIALFMPTILRKEQLGAKEYRWLWYCGAILWLALLQGIRLAYWPLYAGWIALSLYCGVYLPLWICTTRKLIHDWRIPWQIAAPWAWVSWELFRGYFVTGFSACLLGHTVVHQTQLIQIASQLGGYGVSAMIVISGGILFEVPLIFPPLLRLLRRATNLSEINNVTLIPSSRLGRIFSIVSVVAWIVYGIFSLSSSAQKNIGEKPLLTAALIQENSPTMFEANPERNARSWQNYMELTRKTRLENPSLDLIVWPESVFTADDPILDLEPGFEVPAVLADQVGEKEALEELSKELLNRFRMKAEIVQQSVAPKQKSSPGNRQNDSSLQPSAPHLIVGNDVLRIRGNQMDRFNAAVWIDREGNRSGYYAKRHLVMFGEYIPLGSWFPIFYSAFGMAPASSGESASTFDLDKDIHLAPTICFENVLPHLNRRSIIESQKAGKDPSIMINLTNDGWFRGSSILDHHLSCATFACVENRRPMLIAANTGLSAWIDGSGNQIAVTKRLASGVIIAKPHKDSRHSLWLQLGDWPWWIAASVCWTLWGWPVAFRKSKAALV